MPPGLQRRCSDSAVAEMQSEDAALVPRSAFVEQIVASPAAKLSEYSRPLTRRELRDELRLFAKDELRKEVSMLLRGLAYNGSVSVPAEASTVENAAADEAAAEKTAAQKAAAKQAAAEAAAAETATLEKAAADETAREKAVATPEKYAAALEKAVATLEKYAATFEKAASEKAATDAAAADKAALEKAAANKAAPKKAADELAAVEKSPQSVQYEPDPESSQPTMSMCSKSTEGHSGLLPGAFPEKSYGLVPAPGQECPRLHPGPFCVDTHECDNAAAVPDRATEDSAFRTTAMMRDGVPTAAEAGRQASKESDKDRKGSKLPQWIRDPLLRLVEHHYFDSSMGLVVLANAATLGAQTDYTARNVVEDSPLVFRIIEVIFCGIFVTELCIRLVVYGGSLFIKEDWKWNVFDCLVVGLQILEQVFQLVLSSQDGRPNPAIWTAMRFLRLGRIARVVRVMRLNSELRSVVLSMMDSFKALVWTAFFLFLLMYIVGICMTQLVLDTRLKMNQDSADEEIDALVYYYGSLGRSILSLFQSITSGIDWNDMAEPLMAKVSPVVGALLAGYIAVAVLAVLNVIASVLIESYVATSAEDRDAKMIKRARGLFSLVDEDGNGGIDSQEFKASLDDPQMQSFFKAIQVDIADAQTIFELLDADGDGEIDCDEMLSGCLRLRGQAKSIDLASLIKVTKNLSQQHEDLASMVETRLDSLSKLMLRSSDQSDVRTGGSEEDTSQASPRKTTKDTSASPRKKPGFVMLNPTERGRDFCSAGSSRTK
eukprot:gnl/TRDRNA2_/TRDRNA2_177983_c0_seq1.p1 gnl/TRDRNA2_/TRDRNA2_177983_c0~~gnl/TRDRNA2_/TRDRNA2_177983_c0_seq1.p1  ORF type:complete len:774 (-),score=148.33 gnl/TRDRNA2_/TRDRNA2_177983_c0_seq1:291-2612(-)